MFKAKKKTKLYIIYITATTKIQLFRNIFEVVFFFSEEDGCSCQSNLSGTSLAKMCENVTLMFVDKIEGKNNSL
jgi:hypothetical protein